MNRFFGKPKRHCELSPQRPRWSPGLPCLMPYRRRAPSSGDLSVPTRSMAAVQAWGYCPCACNPFVLESFSYLLLWWDSGARSRHSTGLAARCDRTQGKAAQVSECGCLWVE